MSLFDHHQNINGENENNDVSSAFSNDSSFIGSYIFFILFRGTSRSVWALTTHQLGPPPHHLFLVFPCFGFFLLTPYIFLSFIKNYYNIFSYL